MTQAVSDVSRRPILWLARTALEAMTREAASRHPFETGGVMLGYAGERDDVVVTTVIGPGPRAFHARSRFIPDHAYHDAEVARLYEASGRRWTYLGDWHTHPDAAAYLSPTDAETLERIAGARMARVSFPVMLGLGQQHVRPAGNERCAEGWYVVAWRHIRPRALWARMARGRPTPRHAALCTVVLFDAPAAGFDFPGP